MAHERTTVYGALVIGLAAAWMPGTACGQAAPMGAPPAQTTPAPAAGDESAVGPVGEEETGQPVEATRVVALVGDQTVLAGDLFPLINRYIEDHLQKAGPQQRAMLTEEVLKEQRWLMLRQVLPNAVDTKLAYLDFLRTMPSENVQKALDELYRKYDEAEMPKAMKTAEVETPAELDRKLRALGSSLEKERRSFAERLVAQAMIGRNIHREQEVTHADMLKYYETHQVEFSYKAKVRWEQLCVLRANHTTEADARRKLAQMGNEVLHGAPLSAVAQRSSEGLTAKEGGTYDWTEEGSLASTALNEALFSLPLGRLSTIIADSSGFHIVRVTERQPAGVLEFPKVQKQIEEAIRRERMTEQAQAYLESLRKKTPVWTAFELPESPRRR